MAQGNGAALARYTRYTWMAENVDAPYQQLVAALGSGAFEDVVARLQQEVDLLFVNAYYELWPAANVVAIPSHSYTYLFDVHHERMVGVYGLVSTTTEKRDAARMKGFIGGFTKIEPYKDYDKGHYIAHTLNGDLDQNLYPQLREFNRGWSKEGKVFRSMERYCASNPGCFLFTRPLYADDSWIPAELDYGIYRTDQTLWAERFQNRKK